MSLLNNLIKGKLFQTRTGTGFLRAIVNQVGDVVTKPLLGPIRYINNIIRHRSISKLGRLTTLKSMSKVARRQRWSRSGILKRSANALKKAAAWPLAFGAMAIGKKLFGGSSGFGDGNTNPGKSLASGSNFDPIQPVNASDHISDSNLTPSNESIKAQRDEIKSQLDTKVAEARASKIAADRLSSELVTTVNKSPDKITEIYSRSPNTSDQLDAIIRLLNKQVEVTNESRLNTHSVAKNLESELKSRSTRESELYSNLISLRTKQNSANQDAIKAIQKSNDKVVSQLAKSRDDLKSYRTESSKSSLAKWMLFGGISLGVYKLIQGLGGIGNTISTGFNYIKDGLDWIGSKLGFIHTDMTTIAEEQMASEANDPNLESSVKDPNTTENSIVTQNDYINPDTNEIDKESATRSGVNTTYKAQNTGNYMAGAMALGSTYDLYKAAKKVNKADRLASRITQKALNKGLDPSEVKKLGDKAWDRVAGVKSKPKKTGLWSKLKSGIKSSIKDKIQSVSKLASESAIGKVVTKGFSSIKNIAWKGVSKIIGAKGVRVLQTFASSVAKYSSKLAKAGAKKIPGVGLIFGLVDSIYRGFKEGDWTGALISALAGIASTFPGLGTAVSIALDGLQIGRDIYNEKQAEKDSIEVDNLLKDLQRSNIYKPGERGNLINEVIRKFGGTDDRKSEELKNKVIKKLNELYKNEDYNSWSDLRKLAELNRALDGTGIRYNTLNGSLIGLASYENSDNSNKLNKYESGTKFHPGGEAVVGDGNKQELIITPDNKAYITPDTPTLVDIPKGSKVIPEIKELDDTSRKVRAYASGTDRPNYVELNPKPLTPLDNLSVRDQRILYSMDYLVKNLELDPKVAAGLVGNIIAESNLDPSSINKSEKYGTAQSKGIKYRPTGYGAGLIQWTNVYPDTRKDDILDYINKKFNKNYNKVEDSNLTEQLDAIVYEFKSRPKNYNKFINSNSIKSAVDTALRGYINGSTNRLASIEAMNRYTWAGGYEGLMNKRTSSALEAYNKYTGNSVKISDLNINNLNNDSTKPIINPTDYQSKLDDLETISETSTESDEMSTDIKNILSRIFTNTDYKPKINPILSTSNLVEMNKVKDSESESFIKSTFTELADKLNTPKWTPQPIVNNSGGNVVNNNTTHIHIQSNNALENELS